MEEFDYVIVGGGSAGCIVAAELAQDPSVRVLLLEKGPRTEEHPETLDADGYKDAFINDEVIWERFSVPQPHAADQRIFLGSGTGLGGSGSVNGMVYTRGAALDYDQWPKGWQWKDVVPDFEAMERVLRPNRRSPTAFTEACIAAAELAGFRRKDDLNDGDLSGVLGYEWMSYEGDRRRSSYVSFLLDRGPRPNLVVETGALVHRILVDERRRATGVRYALRGELREVRAKREVVMAAGALETPKLLLLSGIGPSHVLRAAGIPVVVEVDGVGRDLHDHPNVPMFYVGKKPVDCFYPQLYGFHRANPELDLPKEQSDTCYVFYPARSSLKQATKRVLPSKVLSEARYTDANRARVRKALDVVYGTGLVDPLIDRMYGIVVILGKPTSRGTVTLASGDPKAQARLDPAYLATPEDRATMVNAVKLARRIAQATPLSRWGNVELNPSALIRTDAEIEAWVSRNAITTYHFAGTVRMGDDSAAVTDSRLRMKAVSALRIADASAIPFTPVSALNAPSMLVGYRAARYLREDAARS